MPIPPSGTSPHAYPAIREECAQLLAPRAPALSRDRPGRAGISSVDSDRHWYVFMLYILGHKPEANRALCPATCEALARVPNLVQAFFSILDAGKRVRRHEGPYLGYLRYHLGAAHPAGPPTPLDRELAGVRLEGGAGHHVR